MYFDATSPYLDAERVKYLDDSFLRSDPWAYFRARIRSLIRGDAALEAAPEAAEGEDPTPEQRLRVYLQVRPDALDDVTASAIETQVAADAYALRHHAAECLIRFTAAVAKHRGTPGTSLWEALAETANQIEPVIREVRAVLSAPDGGFVFTSMVTPPEIRAQRVCDQRLSRDVGVLWEWVFHAMHLLHGHELGLSAAHNKMKHGLAVRARNDIRMTFTKTPPKDDGNVPLSSLTGPDAIEMFGTPVIEVLARPPKVGGHKQGLELTQLRVDVPAVLAEAYMMAWTHAAMFHTAAAAHVASGQDEPDAAQIQEYPGLPMGGPRPTHIAPKAQVGLRFPLTLPPNGGPARDAGIGFRDVFVPIKLTGEPIRGAIVTDD